MEEHRRVAVVVVHHWLGLDAQQCTRQAHQGHGGGVVRFGQLEELNACTRVWGRVSGEWTW